MAQPKAPDAQTLWQLICPLLAAWPGLGLAAAPSSAASANSAKATKAAQSTATLPMRLPGDMVPKAVALAITPDPAQPTHSGTVDIQLQLLRATHSIRLHAKDVAVQHAWLDTGAQRLPATVRRLDGESLPLPFKQVTPAGVARLTVVFTGKLQDKDVDGLFRRLEPNQPNQPGAPGQGNTPGARYAMTQFESTGARLAFPAFDEPGWKLPWTL